MNHKQPRVVDLNKYPSYMGGDTFLVAGYIWEFCPRHPLANQYGAVAQHRLIGEKLAGRPLIRGGPNKEVVHHRDENKLNNTLSNLEVMLHSAHAKHHMQKRNEEASKRLTSVMVEMGLKEHGGIFGYAKHIGVHHQTLRNRFPSLIKPYLRSSPIDTSITEYHEHLLETLKYFAPTSMSYAELARLTHVCGKTWRKLAVEHNVTWYKEMRAMTGKRLVYRGKPTRFALGRDD